NFQVPYDENVTWRMSRFAYMHHEDGHFVVRNPLADCLLHVDGKSARILLHEFCEPAPLEPSGAGRRADQCALQICTLLARAQISGPCTEQGEPRELHDERSRQWDLHDLIFHSRSRLGRTEQRIGGTFAFKGEIAPLPAIKPNQWASASYALPQPDLAR